MSAGRGRVLVVVTAAVDSAAADQLVAAHAGDELVVLAPTLLRRLHYWAGDDRGARVEATARAEAWVAALGRRGADARGYVGDADPLQVIEDALVLLAGDEVVITSPSDHWKARGLPQRAQRRLSVPVAELSPAGALHAAHAA